MNKKATQAKINELEKELQKLQKDLVQNNTPESLADYIHEKFCHANHTDQCSYDYEQKYTEYAKAKYLKDANKLIILISDISGYGHSNQQVYAWCEEIVDILSST